MIKNILAVIGVLAIVAAGAALAVYKPWEEKPEVVAADGAAPVVYFDALRPDGVVVERVHIDTGKKPKAVLYVSYSKFFKSAVLLRAFDKSGKEVGRSRRVISGDSEDAGYADFEFDARVPMKAVTFFALTRSQSENAVPAEDIVPAQVSDEASPVPAPEIEAAPETVPAPAPEAVPAEL